LIAQRSRQSQSRTANDYSSDCQLILEKFQRQGPLGVEGVYHCLVVTKSFRALLLSAYGLALGVPLLTALIIVLGPDPVMRGSKYLSPGVLGLTEIRDRIAVVGWWSVTGFFMLLIYRSFSTKSEESVMINQRSRVWPLLVAMAIVLFFVGSVIPIDLAETNNWKHVELWVVVVSVLAYVNLTQRPNTRLIHLTSQWPLGIVLIGEGLPALFQSPATIRDNYHFIFTANELLAPASGLYPLADFQAHYSNFLGFPIAPIVGLIPGHTMSVLVAYLLALQMFCLCVPAIVSRITGQRRLLLPLTLIPIVLVTTSNENGEAQHTYFQGFPLRSAMPSLLLIVLVWLVSRTKGLRKVDLLILGALSALTILNNFDFGAPAAASAIAVALLCGRELSGRLAAIAFIAFGGAISLAGVSAVYGLSGRELDLQFFLLFVRLFSEGGYLNAAMPIGGLPIVIVTGFSLGSALGLYAVKRAHQTNEARLMASAAFLLFSSLWGLLSFVYYSGRSFTSTAVGGHSYQLGLVLSGVVLFVVMDDKHLRDQVKKVQTPSLIFPVIAIAFWSLLLSALIGVPSLATSVKRFMARGSEHPTLQYYVGEIDLLRQRGVVTDNPREIGLLLPLSNALQQTGVGRSLLITNHPQFAALMPDFAQSQCQAISESKFTVLIEDAVQTSILDLPACKSILKETVLLEHLGDNLRVLRHSLSENSYP